LFKITLSFVIAKIVKVGLAALLYEPGAVDFKLAKLAVHWTYVESWWADHETPPGADLYSSSFDLKNCLPAESLLSKQVFNC